MARNRALDVAKGIGIVLVVLGHNRYLTRGTMGRELTEAIFSFHMPLFFFISGIFLKPGEPLRDFLVSRERALLRPYFFVLGVLGAIKASFGAPAPELFGTEGPANYFWGMLYGNGMTIAWGPMWFLPHIVVTCLCSLLILKLTANRPRRWIVLVAVFLLAIGSIVIEIFWSEGAVRWGVLELGHLPGLPWGIDLIPVTTAFVLFGFILRSPTQSLRFHWPTFLLSCTLFFRMHYEFDEFIDLNRRQFDDVCTSICQAVLGIYLTLSVASLIAERPGGKLLSYVGSGSLPILIFHTLFQRKTADLVFQFLGDDVAGGIVGLAAGIFVPLLMWEIAKRLRELPATFLTQYNATESA